MARKVQASSILHPGKSHNLDATKFEPMEAAILQVLPAASPGLTVAELKAGVLPLLPQDIFPGGDKAGWWLKAVQLDLESRGVILREPTKPLRLRKA